MNPKVTLYSDASLTCSHSTVLVHAYPPPDPQMRNYLCQKVSNLDEAQARYLHVLGHLFQEVTDELSRLYPNQVATYEELAMGWRKHLETDKYQTRARIYQGVVKRCTSSDLVRALFIVPVIYSFSHFLRQARWEEKYPLPDGATETHSVYAVLQMAKDGLERLIQYINGCCMSIEAIPSDHVKLMLYFDEAHVLSEEISDDSDHKDMFHALCSCFNYFIPTPYSSYIFRRTLISAISLPGDRLPDRLEHEEIPKHCRPL
jgi:hypothetical protein